jgi:hypothetical protein
VLTKGFRERYLVIPIQNVGLVCTHFLMKKDNNLHGSPLAKNRDWISPSENMREK